MTRKKPRHGKARAAHGGASEERTMPNPPLTCPSALCSPGSPPRELRMQGIDEATGVSEWMCPACGVTVGYASSGEEEDAPEEVWMSHPDAMTPEQKRWLTDPNYKVSISIQLRLGEFLQVVGTLDDEDDSTRYLKDIARGTVERFPDAAGWIVQLALRTHRRRHRHNWQASILKGDEPDGVVYMDLTARDEDGWIRCCSVPVDMVGWFARSEAA